MEAQLTKFVSDHQRDRDNHLSLLMMTQSSYDTTEETPAVTMMGAEPLAASI